MRIQCDYEGLDRAAARCVEEAERLRQRLTQLQRALDALRDGLWIGKSAQVFFAECEGDGALFVGIDKLIRTLYDTDHHLRQIGANLRETDADNANHWKSALSRLTIEAE